MKTKRMDGYLQLGRCKHCTIYDSVVELQCCKIDLCVGCFKSINEIYHECYYCKKMMSHDYHVLRSAEKYTKERNKLLQSSEDWLDEKDTVWAYARRNTVSCEDELMVFDKRIGEALEAAYAESQRYLYIDMSNIGGKITMTCDFYNMTVDFLCDAFGDLYQLEGSGNLLRMEKRFLTANEAMECDGINGMYIPLKISRKKVKEDEQQRSARKTKSL